MATKSCQDVGGEGATFGPLMSTCSDRLSEVAASQPSTMADLLTGAQPLVVVVEQLEGHANPVAEVQLADVADMDLGGVDGVPALFRA